MRALTGLGPVWMYARADLRRRWKSAVAIAILIGIAGAVVLTAYAGARRTDSAYPRYLTATHAADFLVATESSGPSFTNRFYDRVAALPEVRRSGIVLGPSLVYVSPGGHIVESNEAYVQVYASEDGRAGYGVGGFKLLAGRLPKPDRPFEALANRTLAVRRHLHAGSRFRMYAVDTNASPAQAVGEVHHERPVIFTITGIGVSYDEIVPVAPSDGVPTLFTTPAYFRAHHSPAETNFDGIFVQLRPNASRSAFQLATSRTWHADSAKYNLGALYVADLSLHYRGPSGPSTRMRWRSNYSPYSSPWGRFWRLARSSPGKFGCPPVTTGSWVPLVSTVASSSPARCHGLLSRWWPARA